MSLITTLKAEFADRLRLRKIITDQQESNLKNRPYATQRSNSTQTNAH